MSEEDLYALPLEQFIAARDQLAKETRKHDKDAAARLAKLPKPTPAAWTANQVGREQPDLIAALLDAGAALRAAQDAALAGGGADTLREATQAERRAVDDVMRAAVELKPSGKPLSRAMADRLRTTLHAAAGDPELRTALKAGRLVGEAQAGGAWPFALDSTAALPEPKPKPKPAAEPDPEAEARAERERQALEDELREAKASLQVRERVAKGAEEDARDTTEALHRARAAVEQAQAALEQAEQAATSAERVLNGARKERDQARDVVARLEERLD